MKIDFQNMTNVCCTATC